MDLSFSDEQEELRRIVRAFLADASPEEAVRRAIETAQGYEPAVWTRMATGPGLQGLAVPEDLGGQGAGPVEAGIVFEEMGRALYCGPYLASFLASRALIVSGDAGAARDLLPGVLNGSAVATFAFGGAERAGGPPGVTARAVPEGAVLDGAESLVLDGAHAGLLLVTADGPDGLSLYAVAGDAPGLTRTPLRTLDPSRRLASVAFAGTPARPVGAAGTGARIVADAALHGALALAAEAVGGARFLLDLSVGYVKDRVQFGEPIGSFQAVQHACAHLYVDVESARAAAHHALFAAAEGSPDLPLAVSLAKAHCTDAFARVATETIQLLGGIGVTWEHPAHLYFRRARSSQLLFGSSDSYRDAMVEHLSAEEATR